MTEPSVSFAGNLTDQPELQHTQGGIARSRFRVAVSGHRDQEASFSTVVVWRDQAEHVAESLSKGSRVVVVGRLQQRSWTADGSARSTVEVMAEELRPSLRWGDGDHDQDEVVLRQVEACAHRPPRVLRIGRVAIGGRARAACGTRGRSTRR